MPSVFRIGGGFCHDVFQSRLPTWKKLLLRLISRVYLAYLKNLSIVERMTVTIG